MESAEFWTLMESAVAAHEDREDRERWLVAALSVRPAEDIADFADLLDGTTAHAQTWLMWGAAHRILGWCSDDGFQYFRLWLVGLGRAVFEDVAADPDRLAGVPEVQRLADHPHRDWTAGEWPEWEGLADVADAAYRAATGVEPPPRKGAYPTPLADEHWDFENPEEAVLRLPRLVALFPVTDRQRDQEFDRQLVERGTTPAAFYFGGDGGGTQQRGTPPRAERTRAWLRQWRPGDSPDAGDSPE